MFELFPTLGFDWMNTSDGETSAVQLEMLDLSLGRRPVIHSPDVRATRPSYFRIVNQTSYSALRPEQRRTLPTQNLK